jgi:uncharacterized protein (TIGR00369 family)
MQGGIPMREGDEMNDEHIDKAVPPGFEPTPMGGPFVAANGPFHVSQADGRHILGVRIERRHCNSLGHCHGGMLSSFADMMMPVSMYPHPQLAAHPHFLPTVSLQLDFLAPVQLGDWLEGHAEVLKITRSVVFAQGLARVNGKPVLRCSGVYKVGAPIPAGSQGMYISHVHPIAPRNKP